MPPPPPPRRTLLDAYCDWLWRRHRWVLSVALVVAGASGWSASHLELRTNFAELLPSKDPAVEELRRTGSRIGGTQVLQVAVESPSRDANLKFAGDLVARLRKLPPDLIAMVAYDVREERAFFAARKWLYADLDTLEQLRDSLRAQLDRAKNPMLVDLLDPGDPPDELERRLRARSAKFDAFPTGFFEGDGGAGPGSIVAVVIRPPGGFFGERVGEKLRDEVLRIIAELKPESYGRDLKVGLTGDVMSQLEERSALENDLVWATSICVLLVCAVVVLFYGRFRAVPFVAIPALIGVAAAFGCADRLFGYLNTSTAFMGSIVVGNGINFAIIQMARYEEERRGGRAAPDAMRIALSSTIRATAIAALGAAVSYGSLTATHFRGFSQFGMIGGIGMVVAWVATVTVLPSLWAMFDRRGESQARRFHPPGQGIFSEGVSRAATRAPRLLLGVSLVLSVLALIPLRSYLRDPFEYDFKNLRNRRSVESGAAALAPRVDRIFGKTLTPAVIVAEKREQTEEIRSIIFERDKALPGARLIGDVRTLDDFLPGSHELQEQKLGVLSEIRELVDDPAIKLLADADRKKLTELRPPEGLAPVRAEDLPAQILQPFTEIDEAHVVGRIILVYHDEHVSVWDGRNLMRIADIIGEMQLHDGTIVRSSGHAVIFAAMIRSIDHDAPLATGASFLGVALLVMMLAKGRRGAGLVIGTLVIGVVWMLGAAAWIGVKTNFLNFIALPITFGIGVDYGINIYLRYLLEGRGRVGRAVRATGGAVALCSLTTIIGYGALLVADNQALKSFGEMAILGEVACLCAAVAVMPALLVTIERRWKAAPADDPASRRRVTK